MQYGSSSNVRRSSELCEFSADAFSRGVSVQPDGAGVYDARQGLRATARLIEVRSAVPRRANLTRIASSQMLPKVAFR